jgi:transcription termination factor NusB
MSAAGKGSGKGLSRSRARLAAVQALYQMDLAETDLGAVLEEFSANPLVDDAEADGLGKPDADHLSRVLKGVVARQREIDPLIDQQLATGWRLVRIDSIVRAILRASSSASTSRWRTPSSKATSPRSSTVCSTSSPASCAKASCPTAGNEPGRATAPSPPISAHPQHRHIVVGRSRVCSFFKELSDVPQIYR